MKPEYDGRYCNATCPSDCHHARIYQIDYDTYADFTKLEEIL